MPSMLRSSEVMTGRSRVREFRPMHMATVSSVKDGPDMLHVVCARSAPVTTTTKKTRGRERQIDMLHKSSGQVLQRGGERRHQEHRCTHIIGIANNTTAKSNQGYRSGVRKAVSSAEVTRRSVVYILKLNVRDTGSTPSGSGPLRAGDGANSDPS